MSDTPRTDEIQNEWAGSGLTWEVMFEFCRKLERIVRRCHEALGEDAESDDETLPNSIALHVREGRERIAELERELAQRPEERHAVTGPDEWGSVYVHFQPARIGEHGAVAKTMRHEQFVNFDYDKNGKLYGIELLDVRSDMNNGGDSNG